MNDNGKNETALTVAVDRSIAMAQRNELEVQDVVAQIEKIQTIKRTVMKKDVHYGRIPGTDKDTLYKSGGEILAMTFRFAPKFSVSVEPLEGAHREYSCICTLSHILTGSFLAEGVGSCNTMETKYRYRKAEGIDTGKPVPKQYWELRKQNKIAQMQQLIGGKGHSVKKIDGVWKIIADSGNRVEHDNPADYFNTCLKMAKKRAYVDAVITASGGSGDWTQDLEDSIEEPEPTRSTPPPPATPSQNSKAPRASIEVQARETPADFEPPEWPEEPSEAEIPPATTTANNAKSPASPVPASERPIGDLENLLIEWRSKAIEADPKMGGIRFDGVLKAQLKLHRVQRFDQLARDGQEKVFNAMRMVTEGMFPMPSSGKKSSKLAEKLNALAQNATANE